MIDWKKYLIVFLITLALFLSAGYLSSYFNQRKLAGLSSIQEKIALDILSSEIQFSLLSELSCKNTYGSVLSDELEEIGRKLEWSESNLGRTEEVIRLKRYYTLLEIKDYLLYRRISERCKTRAAFILYFYTTRENCSECERQGFALSALREKYPELRVYSLDYSIALAAVRSLLQIYKIEDTRLPAIVLGDEVLSGFRTVEELEKRIKDSFELTEGNHPSLR